MSDLIRSNMFFPYMSTDKNLQRPCPCEEAVLKRYNWWRERKLIKKHKISVIENRKKSNKFK